MMKLLYYLIGGLSLFLSIVQVFLDCQSWNEAPKSTGGLMDELHPSFLLAIVAICVFPTLLSSCRFFVNFLDLLLAP